MIRESETDIREQTDLNSGTAKIRITHKPSGKYVDSEYICAGNNRLDTISRMWVRLEAEVNPPIEQSSIMKFFEYEHLPDHLKILSASICKLAQHMDSELKDGPEKSAGLRKLLEAKDCFVRARL